jgi:hypothetical protein
LSPKVCRGRVTDRSRTGLALFHRQGAPFFALSHRMVRQSGVEPLLGGYQPPRLPLTYRRRGSSRAASGFRPRVLLVGNEASYWLDYGREWFRGCQGGSRTRSALFQGQLSVPVQSAWQRGRVPASGIEPPRPFGYGFTGR